MKYLRRSCRSALHDRKRHLELGDFLTDFLLIFWKQHLGFGWFFADFLKATFVVCLIFCWFFESNIWATTSHRKVHVFCTHFAKTCEFLCSDICILSPKFSISDFGRSEADFLPDFLLIFWTTPWFFGKRHCWFFERPSDFLGSDIADFLNDPPDFLGSDMADFLGEGVIFWTHAAPICNSGWMTSERIEETNLTAEGGRFFYYTELNHEFWR